MTLETFLKEFKKVSLSFPKLPDHILSSQDCTFSDYVFWSKNLYNCFDCAKCSDSSYIYDSILCANCFDCDYAAECELCYESENPFKCFNCEYLSDCSRLRDSAFSYACTDCHDIFGCVHLKNKSFCIFNRQFSEAEYREKVKAFKNLSAEQILQMVDELEKKYPWTQTFEGNNLNSEYGNYIYQNKNCYLCFDAFKDENCAYLFDASHDSHSYDLTYSYESNLAYESVDCDRMFNTAFTAYCDKCADSSYLFNCADCKNCLGCVGLAHKQYCILNRQLSKEEYEKVSGPIFSALKNTPLAWADLNF